MCEIRSKLTIKTLEGRHWCRSDAFIVNFEQILHIVLLFSTDDFEHVNMAWVKDVYINTSSLRQNEFTPNSFPHQLVLAKWIYRTNGKFDRKWNGIELSIRSDLTVFFNTGVCEAVAH